MAFKEYIYPTWAKLTRINRNAMRRSSDRGRLVQTATFICAAVGLDTDLSYAYQLFALLICLLFASRISLKFSAPEVSIRRRLPRYATADEPFEYGITVINEGEHVERDLTIADNPKVIPPPFEQFQQMREPGEETRNAYDRWIGWHRFVWLQRLNTGINVKNAKVPDVELRSSAEAVMHATPLRRGIVSFESTTILHPDPFGLNYGVTDYDSRESLIVLPKRFPVSKQFHFEGGRHFQPGGVNSTWSIGESDEFVSLRDYRDGDPIRKIHWATSAKRDKPVVKEFQDEFFVRQALIVDTFEQTPAQFEALISVAASLLIAVETNDGLMDLCFVSDTPQVITAGRGYAQTSQQLEALALMEKATGTSDDLIKMLIERSRLLSGALFVLSGIAQRHLDMLAAIESRGVQTAVFVVTPDAMNDSRADFHFIHPDNIAEGLANL